MMPETDRPIPPDGVAALRRLVRLGGEGMERLSTLIAEIGPILASTEVRAKLIENADANFLALDELVAILRDAVVPLASIQRRIGLEPAEFFELVSTWLNQVPSEEWPAESSAGWEKDKQAISRLFGLNVFSVEEKARSLVEDRPNWVQGIGVLSELRPVPDESGDQTQAMLIMNTLSIRYRSGNAMRTAYFSLDPVDLDELEREISKAKNLNSRLRKKLAQDRVPVLMLGRNADSDASDEEER